MELENLFYLFPECNVELKLHEDYALFLPRSESWMKNYRYYSNAKREWSYPESIAPQNYIRNRETIQSKPSTYGDTRVLTYIISKHFLSLYSSRSISYFDVGSYVGNFSIQTALLSKYEGIDIKIWAFEPSPIFKLLQQSININNVNPKIVLVNSAISNVNGPILLSYNLGELIGADIGSQQRRNRPSISQICNSTTIDSFVKSGSIDNPSNNSFIIKLDCQGFEHQVFEGCKSILSQNLPLVFLSEFLCWSFKANRNFYSTFLENFHIVDVKSHMKPSNCTYVKSQNFPEFVEKLNKTKQPWTDLVLIPKKLKSSEILVEEILKAGNQAYVTVSPENRLNESNIKLLNKNNQIQIKRQRYMEKGDELRRTEQLEEAVLMYRKVIDLEPCFSWSYHKIGEILSQQGKFNEAILFYKKAIELNSKSAWSYHFLGVALSQQGDWEQALVAYRKALSLDSNISWSHRGIGNIFLENNEIDKALEEYQKAIQLNEGVETFKIDLRRALQSREKYNIDSNFNQLNILSSPQKFSYSKKSHFDELKKFGIYQNVRHETCDLKAYQDLLVYNFIVNHIPGGSKLLEIGGGNSRIIQELKNDYEIWNIDKFEGVGNGPTHIDSPTDWKLVQAYMGDFSPELKSDYFDFVFSISTLEHIPDDEHIFKNICDDINRVLKPQGLSLHAIDVVLKRQAKDNKFSLWTKGIIPYIFNHISTLNQMVSLSQIVEDNDLYVLSKRAYERGWQPHTGKTYEDFGMPFSYQVIWQK